MIRRNPQRPRSGLAADFWRAVVSSAFWNTKEVPRQLQEEARRRVVAGQPPLTLDECVSIASDTLDQPYEAVRVHVLEYLAAYVRRSFKNARDALQWLMQRDRRLSVWGAAQVARWALAIVPKPKARSMEAKAVIAAEGAILAAEGWVHGEVSDAEVRKAAYAASAYYAADASTSAAEWTEARDAALLTLRGVVADAILGFPTASARMNPRRKSR